MTNRLSDRHTPARFAWLRHLRDNGPSVHKGRGSAAFGARVFGWTRWIGEGAELEELTELGRAKLAEWEQRDE